MTADLDLEEKYHVKVAGMTVLLPYTLAKKQAAYPELCIWHPEAPVKAAAGAHLCSQCIEWLRTSLEDIAKYWPDLEDALAPAGGRAASSERVGGTGELYPPLPINGDISDILRDARRSVWLAVGHLIQDRPEQRLPRDHNTNILADWFARWHVDYLASHPSARHLHDVGKDLARVARKMKEAAYQAQPTEVEMDSSCHQPGCPGSVVATQLPDGRKVVRCSEDITHRIAADQWFYTHANRRPGSARNALKKKYLSGRKA
ncbi:hypothetical protein QEO77_gp40 [Arthrobacter phage Zaheer]|uniref:Uncharacterized protein n=1 Tax=Arthrobacter phage Zaheer TaxID=2836041 RepID=A0A8F3IQ40_9CAUD|nr:hypothetical protein QEO77_gp40 [Arthrobacter phage Zaheer]QWY84263.1 hypothetical protein SEA_ZAHEER_67 [Arthrobacter phage Zaheer]